MHDHTRGRSPCKLGIENKNWEATPKSCNGHAVAPNSDFKLQSDEQEIMPTQ